MNAKFNSSNLVISVLLSLTAPALTLAAADPTCAKLPPSCTMSADGSFQGVCTAQTKASGDQMISTISCKNGHFSLSSLDTVLTIKPDSSNPNPNHITTLKCQLPPNSPSYERAIWDNYADYPYNFYCLITDP